ncbi:D-lactaldehyde dehydrogenase [Ceratobasidium sp. AG-I]|nr:D-lactaldehyde dehydrogenase [Ceratobasidium sp. AG-I]
MPFIAPPAKILLTGANGYFATYATKDLLERGYTVVGTVRTEKKGQELVKLYAQYGGRFNYTVVPDIVKSGAFDQVIKDSEFDGVAHAASPVFITNATVDDYFRPAIQGTTGILESIKSYGPTVKRVVLTSSAVTAFQNQKGLKQTDTHWNEAVLEVVKEQGDKAGAGVLYTASKTLAEKAAWKFVEDNKDKINFDLVAVLPLWILGPPINAVNSRDELTSTNAAFSGIRTPRPDSELTNTAITFIHAKDMATLHSVSFSRPDAAGRRVLGVGIDASWQEIYDALNEDPAFPGVPKGNPGSVNRPVSEPEEWDTSYTRELLGRDFVGIQETFRETEAYYQEKGWSFVN